MKIEWKNSLPKEAGFYWWRQSSTADHESRVVEIAVRGGGRICQCVADKLVALGKSKLIGGQWAGPLARP